MRTVAVATASLVMVVLVVGVFSFVIRRISTEALLRVGNLSTVFVREVVKAVGPGPGSAGSHATEHVQVFMQSNLPSALFAVG